MNSSGKPEDILVKLNEMAGYDPDQDIDMFEVSPSASHVQLCSMFAISIKCNNAYILLCTLRRSSLCLMSCVNGLTRNPHSVRVRYTL